MILVREKVVLKHAMRPLELFTLLNTMVEKIIQDIYHINVIPKPLAP